MTITEHRAAFTTWADRVGLGTDERIDQWSAFLAGRVSILETTENLLREAHEAMSELLQQADDLAEAVEKKLEDVNETS